MISSPISYESATQQVPHSTDLKTHNCFYLCGSAMTTHSSGSFSMQSSLSSHPLPIKTSLSTNAPAAVYSSSTPDTLPPFGPKSSKSPAVSLAQPHHVPSPPTLSTKPHKPPPIVITSAQHTPGPPPSRPSPLSAPPPSTTMSNHCTLRFSLHYTLTKPRLHEAPPTQPRLHLPFSPSVATSSTPSAKHLEAKPTDL
jgi:hypothetical protein